MTVDEVKKLLDCCHTELKNVPASLFTDYGFFLEFEVHRLTFYINLRYIGVSSSAVNRDKGVFRIPFNRKNGTLIRSLVCPSVTTVYFNNYSRYRCGIWDNYR